LGRSSTHLISPFSRGQRVVTSCTILDITHCRKNVQNIFISYCNTRNFRSASDRAFLTRMVSWLFFRIPRIRRYSLTCIFSA
jgi:hypothetical protein